MQDEFSALSHHHVEEIVPDVGVCEVWNGLADHTGGLWSSEAGNFEVGRLSNEQLVFSVIVQIFHTK